YAVTSSSSSVTATWSNEIIEVSLAEGFFGAAMLTLTATDGTEVVSYDWAVMVQAVNDAPVVSGSLDSLFLQEDTDPVQVSTIGLFTDPDGDPLTYAVTSSSTSVTATWSNEIIEVSLADDFFGAAMLTLTATDGTEAVSYDWAITVQTVNDAPVVSGSLDSLVLQEDDDPVQVSTMGLFTDPDGDPLTYAVTSSSSSVTATWSNEIMEVSLAEGFFGAAMLTLTANDGTEAVSYDWVVTVQAVNDAPVVSGSL
ncbi:MAG TPA: hypothetical protein DCE41_36645, partial [Cytophagales bacterium]|nr:hypothetical protein [Cytophagales bacterium]